MADTINLSAIQWALGALPDGTDEIADARDYYAGNHSLTFATKKFRNAFGRTFGELKINLCQLVVDVVADRLQVAGFAAINADGDLPDIAAAALEIWEMNRMDVRAVDLFVETLVAGQSGLLVWPDAQGNIVWYPQDAGTFAVQYHAEQPGYIVRAAKWWHDEGGRIRLTIYTRETIEKYVTPLKCDKTPARADAFERFIVEGESWPLVNKWNRCPVFNLTRNKKKLSMLTPIKPSQNGLNKTTCDMMVAQEFFAQPQRWATGVETPDENDVEPWKSAADRIWSTENDVTKFGQFPASDPGAFLSVRQAFVDDIALIAGVPPHYFSMRGGDVASGVALQILETRLERLVEKLQARIGNALADAMRLSLLMQNKIDESVRIKTLWKNTAPVDAKAIAETQEIKKRVGVSERQALREMGYSDAQIDQFAADTNGRPTLVIDPKPGGEPDIGAVPINPADAGIQADKTLNGAQITAALEILAGVKGSGDGMKISPFVGVQLLTSVGLARETAQAMVDESTK